MFGLHFKKSVVDEKRLGQVLIDKKLITEKQLETALDTQRERLIVEGRALPLGKVICSLSFASEADIVAAINAYYGLNVRSLSDDIVESLKRIRGSFVDRMPRPRIPIWVQLSLTMAVVIVTTIMILNLAILNRQKDRLYDQTIRIGRVSLNYFDNTARIPMIQNDILQLNTLIRNATEVEGLLYAVIVDTTNQIKAHSDHSLIGTPLKQPDALSPPETVNDVTYYQIRMPDGDMALNLSKPIRYRDKLLGEVHVGVSIVFIRSLIAAERTAIISITLGILLFGLFVAWGLGYRFSKPIGVLAQATEEIVKGNYLHKVDLKRNDELGNLALAFNRMGAELWEKKMIQDSFGKYVGTEVLKLIMAAPESTWLKGHRNEATVLFADIRGFTAFSEKNEPERVVEMLNTYFGIASAMILKHGGYVDKFIGDAILGVFGVPVYRKNHVNRAVQAAVDMQNALDTAGGPASGFLSQAGISLHTGVVVSGNIGSDTRMEYTVIGDTVNVAARINGMAGPGQIVGTKAVCDAMETDLDFLHLSSESIKGKTIPVDIFRIFGMKKR